MAMSVSYTTINGQIVSENRGGVESYYAPDTLGSTAALLDNTGTVTDTLTYWPYGEIQNHTGSSVTPFTFCGTLGYYLDAVLNWIYVRARYFAQILGRWLTVDPLWPFTEAYAYVENSPGVFTDASGLTHWNCDKKNFPFFCSWVWGSIPYNDDPTLENFIDCVEGSSATCNWAAPQGTTDPGSALRSIFGGGAGSPPSFTIGYGGSSGVCSSPGLCAFTNILTRPPTITICQSGIKRGGGCGSLSCTILHELLHATGMGHNSDNNAALACLNANFGCKETISEGFKK